MNEHEKSSGGLGDQDSQDGSSSGDSLTYFSSSTGGDSSGGGPSSGGPQGPPSSGGGDPPPSSGGGDPPPPPPNPAYTMTLIDEFGRADGDPWYNGTFELVNTGNVDIIITGYEYILDSTGLDISYMSVPLPMTIYPGVPDYFYLYGLHDNDIVRIVDNYGINPTHPS
jgi:hypothetical protein